MEEIQAFTDKLYEKRLTQEFDAVIPVVADESMGKSTFILQFMILWRRTTGREVDTDEILDQLVYDKDGYKTAMVNQPPRTVVAAPDAARVMHKKESMDTEQVELEKDLLDARSLEKIHLLGYQDWDVIASFIQRRRAHFAFRIPSRGHLWGYNRASLDEKWDTGDWPDPDLTCRFPSLEGTDIWREYKREDRERKRERIMATADGGGESQSVQQVVDDIKSGNLDAVVGIHGGWNTEIIKPDLIEMEYGLSARDAKKVKTLLENDSAVSVGESNA
jgi:hypothetical protein